MTTSTTAPLGRVLVLTPSFGAYSPVPLRTAEQEGLQILTSRFAHPLDAGQLIEELGDVDAIITGLDDVDARVLASSGRLKVVAKHGVGVDNIDVAAADAHAVTVVNAPGTNSGAVADLALGLMIAASRQVMEADASIRRGEWARFSGPQLEGRTLGLIGLGQIGSAVAARASAFGMTVTAYDPWVPAERFAELGVARLELDTLVRESDIISLHAPYTPGDPPLLDAALLRSTRPGVGLINAARGGLVDEDSLAGLLSSGHIAFAAADAFSTEPPAPDNPLLHAPHIILSPHIGAYSDRANAAMGETIVRDIARVLRGESPHHPVHALPPAQVSTAEGSPA